MLIYSPACPLLVSPAHDINDLRRFVVLSCCFAFLVSNWVGLGQVEMLHVIMKTNKQTHTRHPTGREGTRLDTKKPGVLCFVFFFFIPRAVGRQEGRQAFFV